MALTDTIALTTLANVKGDLGITDSSKDTVLERMILAASEAIARFCNREFRKGSVTETLAGTNTRRLVVNRPPLVSITSIVEDGSTVASTTYAIDDARAGIIYGDSVWRSFDLTLRASIGQEPIQGTGEKTFAVTYVGGYVLPNDSEGTRNLPYDVEEACILTAVALYRSRGRDRAINSEQVGDASVGYGDGAGRDDRVSAGILPAEAQGLLRSYRRLAFV